MKKNYCVFILVFEKDILPKNDIEIFNLVFFQQIQDDWLSEKFNRFSSDLVDKDVVIMLSFSEKKEFNSSKISSLNDFESAILIEKDQRWIASLVKGDKLLLKYFV